MRYSVVLRGWVLGFGVYCVFDTLFVKVLGAFPRSSCGDRDVLQARWGSPLRTLLSNHEKIDILTILKFPPIMEL